MAETPKSSTGQLSNTADSALYTCPASTVAVIIKLTYCETSGSDKTVNAYIRKSGGTSRRIIDKDYTLSANESRSISNAEKHILEAGDSVRGDASTTNVIDWVLSLVEFS